MSLKLRYLYRAYRYRLRVDPAELRFVCSQLQPGQVAADLGCHKGAYTYWMRRRVGPSGAVFAFEPQPNQVAYLRRAFSVMHYDNVEVVPMAASNQCGELLLHIPQGKGETHAASLERLPASATDNPQPPAPSPQPVPVPTITLDDFFSHNRPPDFLKIDVEGHELAVLEGARQTLAEHHPAILIECEARHRPDGNVQSVFDLLHSHGYTGTFFQNGERRPLAEFDAAAQKKVSPNATTLPRDYVNNFAFTFEK